MLAVGVDGDEVVGPALVGNLENRLERAAVTPVSIVGDNSRTGVAGPIARPVCAAVVDNQNFIGKACGFADDSGDGSRRVVRWNTNEYVGLLGDSPGSAADRVDLEPALIERLERALIINWWAAFRLEDEPRVACGPNRRGEGLSERYPVGVRFGWRDDFDAEFDGEVDDFVGSSIGGREEHLESVPTGLQNRPVDPVSVLQSSDDPDRRGGSWFLYRLI
nr:hypothetical protein [Halosolutus gelatinilyticus]